MKENRNDNGILSIYTLIWPFSIGRDKSTGKSNNFKSEPQVIYFSGCSPAPSHLGNPKKNRVSISSLAESISVKAKFFRKNFQRRKYFITSVQFHIKRIILKTKNIITLSIMLL